MSQVFNTKPKGVVVTESALFCLTVPITTHGRFKHPMGQGIYTPPATTHQPVMHLLRDTSGTAHDVQGIIWTMWLPHSFTFRDYCFRDHCARTLGACNFDHLKSVNKAGCFCCAVSAPITHFSFISYYGAWNSCATAVTFHFHCSL